VRFLRATERLSRVTRRVSVNEKASVRGWACGTRGREIRNMPTPWASYRITRLIHPERLFRRRAERFRPGTIPISDRPLELRPRNSAGISMSALGIVTRGQFVSPCIRTYVGHVIHGIIHATNPRYQKIPGTTRRVRLCVCKGGIYART